MYCFPREELKILNKNYKIEVSAAIKCSQKDTVVKTQFTNVKTVFIIAKVRGDYLRMNE